MFNGYEETEAGVLKIALCGKYQQLYSDIDTLCRYCGFDDEAIAEVKRWKYHGITANPLYLTLLLDYIKDNERERYNKALYLYNRNKS